MAGIKTIVLNGVAYPLEAAADKFEAGSHIDFGEGSTQEKVAINVKDLDDVRAFVMGNIDEFDPTSAYDKGTYVVHEDKVYKALVNLVAGAWDAANWQEMSVLEAMAESGGGFVAMTTAQYNALSEEEKNEEKLFVITDDDEGGAALEEHIADTSNPHRVNILQVIPNTIVAHNNHVRGDVLTDRLTLQEIYDMIGNRDYSDIYVGDIIKVNMPAISTVTDFTAGATEFVVGEIENFREYGVSSITQGHICLIPKTILGKAKMNDTNKTEGGYHDSAMATIVLPGVEVALNTAFGTAHILTMKQWESTTVDTTAASMAGSGLVGSTKLTDTWQNNRKASLITEMEAYGGSYFSSSGYDNWGGPGRQLALFRLDPTRLYFRVAWWLSCVCSSTNFCFVGSYGDSNSGSASGSSGVRPRFLIG